MQSFVSGVTKGIKDIADFWKTPEAQMYQLFAKQVIPSNFLGIMVGNTIIGEHLEKTALPRFVIDFGSFKGDSTYRLYKFLTRDSLNSHDIKILGIDSVKEFVDDAAELFKDEQAMSFSYIPSNSPIELSKPASAVSMYFVDQVIPDNIVLQYAFKKIFDAMAPGGILAMLRLSEDSFDPSYNFLFYRHNKNVDDIGNLNNGDPFTNHLILPQRDPTTHEVIRDSSGQIQTNSLTFTDHFRRRDFIFKMLKDSGFVKTGYYNIDHNLTDGANGLALSKAYESVVRDIPEIVKYDEFSKPLHEIIWAIK